MNESNVSLLVPPHAPSAADDGTDTPLSWALVDSARDQVDRRVHGTWGQLVEMVTTHKRAPSKDGSGWLPAAIEPGPRTKERAGPWAVLALDIEAPATDLPDGVKRVTGPAPVPLPVLADELKARGWRAALATSHSHEGPAETGTLGPRYRVVLAVSRPVRPEEIKPLVLHVAALLGLADCLDEKCLDASRLFYLPRCPADRWALRQAAVVDGAPLDVDALLEGVEVASMAPARRAFKASTSSGTVIDLFNEQADIGHIVTQEGYIPKGRNRWMWPGSTSGVPGVVLLPDSGRLYSHHGQDPLCCGAHSHDAFSVWTVLKHAGDVGAAVRAAANMAGIREAIQSSVFDATEQFRQAIQQAPDARVLIESVCPRIAVAECLDKASRGMLAKVLQVKMRECGRQYTMPDCHGLVAPRTEGEPEPDTHDGYARGLLAELARNADGAAVVGADGALYVPTRRGIYEALTFEKASMHVARLYDGCDLCKRAADYLAIAKHGYSIAEDVQFFVDAPVGLACPSGFYQVTSADAIERVPLAHAHRQRFVHEVDPLPGPTPAFTRLLSACFASTTPGEEVAQTRLLQEVFGAVVLGLMARQQVAVLFYGPPRSGKGTITKILEALVPRNSRAAVSPVKWSQEYYLAALAGKRLNVVGELSENAPIPAAEFKTVTGLDLFQGRHPTGRPFDFRNEAAHVFSSNHFPPVSGGDDAFFTRWVVLSFPNSRAGRSDLDPRLADKIVTHELPAVLAWALDGARRLQQRGRFEMTAAHHRHMAAWRRVGSSALEFLHDPDVCEIDAYGFGPEYGYAAQRVALYAAYRGWCVTAGRHQMAQSKFFTALQGQGARDLDLRFVGRDADGTRGWVHGVKLVSEF